MLSTAPLLQQRSIGHVKLRMEQSGVAVLREEGSAKIRLPHQSADAILINTSGGLAGGDRVSIDIAAGKGASLAVTSQSAERIYRTLGPPATVTTHLAAEAGAKLLWLPHETILFDGASLKRSFTVNLDQQAELVAVETIVLGRTEMGETIQRFALEDNWRVFREGKLLHADSIRMDQSALLSPAALAGNTAFSTLMVVAARAEALVEPLRGVIGTHGGVSAWNGKLVARIVTRDGFLLRKLLVQALSVAAGRLELPKTWVC